jgi:hypothetical protein
MMQWISEIIDAVDQYEGMEDFSLPPHLNILSTIQLFVYYVTHHILTKKEFPEMLLACFITIQLVFNDYSDVSNKKTLSFLMKELAPSTRKFLYDPNVILKNQIKLVKFFDYDFYHLALTVNYLVLLNKCLDLDEPTDDYAFISKFEDSIEKNVFDQAENLSLSPYDLTKLLIKDMSK